MATQLIAINLTASPVVLNNLGVTVPGSGQLTLTGVQLFTDDCLSDPELQDAVENNEIKLNNGSVDLPKEAVLQWGAPTAAAGDVKARETSATNTVTTTSTWVTILSIIIPEDGDWLIFASTSTKNSNNNTVAHMAIRVNGGSEIAETERPSGGNKFGNANTTSELPAMSAGDVVDVRYGKLQGGGSVSVSARSVVIWKVELV